MALKSKVKYYVKGHSPLQGTSTPPKRCVYAVWKQSGHNPQNVYLHPLGEVCVEYENNPANAFRDIVRKLNLSLAIN